MTRSRRNLLVFPALGMAAALLWTVVGGVNVARGQDKPVVIKRAHAGSFRAAPNGLIFILALGSDSGAPRYQRGGKPEKGRSDSIHIIAINPQLKKATLVGIPRDSYVPLAPGCGPSPNKINAAMYFGGLKGQGPDCIVRTVELLSGNRIHFNYYMLGGFDNLENMVNSLGGVPVNVEPGNVGNTQHVLKDPFSKSTGIRVGLQTLSGREALAYSRNRHDYGRGDFARTVHQGQVMVGGLTKARALAFTDPGKTLSFLRTIFANVKLDIPLIDAFHLGLFALQIKPADVTNTFLDGTTGPSPAGSSVFLVDPGLILANVADDGVID